MKEKLKLAVLIINVLVLGACNRNSPNNSDGGTKRVGGTACTEFYDALDKCVSLNRYSADEIRHAPNLYLNSQYAVHDVDVLLKQYTSTFTCRSFLPIGHFGNDFTREDVIFETDLLRAKL
jgi:hypothetical protein